MYLSTNRFILGSCYVNNNSEECYFTVQRACFPYNSSPFSYGEERCVHSRYSAWECTEWYHTEKCWRRKFERRTAEKLGDIYHEDLQFPCWSRRGCTIALEYLSQLNHSRIRICRLDCQLQRISPNHMLMSCFHASASSNLSLYHY